MKCKLFMTLIVVLLSLTISAQDTRKHVVDKGETLVSIAERYKTTTSELIKLNPDAKQFIYVGMELDVPVVMNDMSSSQNIQSQHIADAPATQKLGTENAENAPKMSSVNSYESFLTEGRDVFLGYSPDAKIYGIGWNQDINKYFVFHFDICSNFKFKKEDYASTLGIIGAGVHQRYLFNDLLMIGANLYPYIGLSNADELDLTNPNGKRNKTKFTYGARASLLVGFKLFTNKNGNDAFLSMGYTIGAAEFETDGIFKGGMITLGYSIILH